MPPIARTVCLEFFGQVREAVPAIEITDYFKPVRGSVRRGATCRASEHPDERLASSSWPPIGKRHGRPKWY